MLFRLINISATCQRQNNNILRPYLGKFIICYLNNILIYSLKRENYKEYIKLIIKELAKVDS